MGRWKDAWNVLIGNGQTKTTMNASPYNITMWHYNTYGKTAYELDTIRSAVDALARNISKMELKHIAPDQDGNKKTMQNSDLARVFAKPNPYMTMRDLLYKVATYYYLHNNAFIYPDFDDAGHLVALYPINAKGYKVYQYNGETYLKFVIKYTQEYTVPYREVIHLRRFFNDDDVLGDDNNALVPAMELVNATNQGIIKGIANSAVIRGILKATSVIKESQIEADKAKFISDNLSASNNGGIIMVDGKYDYTPVDSKPYMVSAEVMAEAKNKIYDYFGVNEDFVQNKFSADQYDAVYEGDLEPFAMMLQQSFQCILLTQGQYWHGNRIEVSLNRMMYQPKSVLVSLVTATIQQGIFTTNEYRDMFGYPPVEDGDKRLVSLNYVDAKKADDYQNVSDDTNKPDEPDGDMNPDDQEGKANG